MRVILNGTKRRRTPDRMLKSPHLNLLPQGEGTAVARNYRDAQSTGRFHSLPLGETHVQAAVRAVFRQSGGRNLKDFASGSLGFARNDE